MLDWKRERATLYDITFLSVAILFFSSLLPCFLAPTLAFSRAKEKQYGTIVAEGVFFSVFFSQPPFPDWYFYSILATFSLRSTTKSTTRKIKIKINHKITIPSWLSSSFLWSLFFTVFSLFDCIFSLFFFLFGGYYSDLGVGEQRRLLCVVSSARGDMMASRRLHGAECSTAVQSTKMISWSSRALYPWRAPQCCRVVLPLPLGD